MAIFSVVGSHLVLKFHIFGNISCVSTCIVVIHAIVALSVMKKVLINLVLVNIYDSISGMFCKLTDHHNMVELLLKAILHQHTPVITNEAG